MITLNKAQQTSVDGVVNGFLEQDAPGFTLVGEGGTGKTTCSIQIIDRLLQAGLKVLFTAPTNKAVKQLEKAAREYGMDMSKVAFMTLHKALGLALLPDEERQFAAKVGRGVFEDFDVCGIDEASMLSKILLNNYLLPEAELHHVKLLFMGDDMQLPPVREKKSLAFEVFPTFRLIKNERTGENSEILTVTGLLRSSLKDNQRFTHPEGVEGAVSAVQDVRFMETVLSAFTPETNLDDQRVMAWTNRRVDFINEAIRTKIYGKKAARFEPGERLMTGGPIRSGDTTLLSTGEECVLASVREGSLFDEDSREDFKTWVLVLKPIHAEVKQVITNVLHESELERYQDRLNELARKAKAEKRTAGMYWKRYHKFRELFSVIKYCYCITVHNCQGSTYLHAYVDTKDIIRNPVQRERQSLLYVAYSRPRLTLTINKTRYVA